MAVTVKITIRNYFYFKKEKFFSAFIIYKELHLSTQKFPNLNFVFWIIFFFYKINYKFELNFKENNNKKNKGINYTHQC